MAIGSPTVGAAGWIVAGGICAVFAPGRKAQKFAAVWHRGGPCDPAAAAGAKTFFGLLRARRPPPSHVSPAQVDEPRAAILGVDDASERAGRKALLARTADNDRDDAVALVDPSQR